MLLPARALLLWVTALALGALAPAVFPATFIGWAAAAALLLLVAITDAAMAWWEHAPTASRTVERALPLGETSRVTLKLGWAARPRAVEVCDHAPAACEIEGLPVTTRLSAAQVTHITYRLRPTARGDHAFGPIALRVRSPLGLWQCQHRVPAESRVRVYPNFAVYSRHALLAADARSNASGVLKRRRRGQGLDFEQLREYREGDSPRQIDWRATSRIGRLISREYQDERDQRIVLMVDAGRRMGARDGALSHFDHALDTLLLLAWVGLRHGDAVGLQTLGGHHRALAPHKARSTLTRILDAVYDLQPTLEASDFESAAQQLLAREKKRALVVILTNLRDEDDDNLLAAARLLGSRHLVLVASLRERALDEAVVAPAVDLDSTALRGAALDYRARREACFQRLRQAGVLVLDSAPDTLAITTVNRYLAIKAEGRL
ncbi:DUF58 domain-containing protein [Niveibacterium umoris]|uniref:Uncharacterized protein (DUF58 family) n=1 Tax=Niveibacterium umoris TaxID=1193620 RepID=A0A840BVE8_9RHOO|nr:DUF58 domain-containing protein [Niveibacterium umoris]MBB4014297.1 uncharacterized protein (DUF58 family) [Niveibacterium umoris]